MVDWLSSRLNQLGWLMAQHRQYFYDALGRTNGIFNIFDDEYGSDHPAGGIGMCRHDALGRQIKPCADGSPPLAFDGDNIIRALNRRVERVTNPEAKKHRWGKRKLKRDQ